MSPVKKRRRLIFLIGYMASGKTTLGHALAEATGLRFVDLDQYIEENAGRTITQIFQDKGEAHFRQLETLSLEQLTAAGDDDLIIACGGGTPCFGDNMAMMNSHGTSVWLNAPTEVIVRRLIAERSSRPLVARLSDGGELETYVAENLIRRTPHYSKATATFDSSRLESEAEIAESVRLFIDKFL